MNEPPRVPHNEVGRWRRLHCAAELVRKKRRKLPETKVMTVGGAANLEIVFVTRNGAEDTPN